MLQPQENDQSWPGSRWHFRRQNVLDLFECQKKNNKKKQTICCTSKDFADLSAQSNPGKFHKRGKMFQVYISNKMCKRYKSSAQPHNSHAIPTSVTVIYNCNCQVSIHEDLPRISIGRQNKSATVKKFSDDLGRIIFRNFQTLFTRYHNTQAFELISSI